MICLSEKFPKKIIKSTNNWVDVIVLESLPEGSILVTAAKIFFCLGLVCTYPILLCPVPIQMEPALVSYISRAWFDCEEFFFEKENRGEKIVNYQLLLSKYCEII